MKKSLILLLSLISLAAQAQFPVNIVSPPANQTVTISGGSLSIQPVGAAGGDLAGSYPTPQLAPTGVAPGTYGSATSIPVLQIDAKGRIVSVTLATASGGGGSSGPIDTTGLATKNYVNPRFAAINSKVQSVSAATQAALDSAAAAKGLANTVITSLQSITAATTVPYYVDSQAGNDNNAGTLNAPFRTLAKGLSVVPSNGILLLKAGSVFRESLDLRSKGKITVNSYSGGARPIITGANAVTATWSSLGSGVYSVTVVMEAGAATRSYPGIWENDQKLKEYIIGDASVTDVASATATLAANPGSFFFAGPGDQASGWSAGVKTFYISTGDGSNPNSNGLAYEHTARQYTIQYAGATLQNLVVRRMMHHDGLVNDGTPGYLLRVVVQDFARHGIIDPASLIEECTVMKGNVKYPGILFHGYRPSYVAGIGPRYKKCVAIGSFGASSTDAGFGAHGVNPGTSRIYDQLVYEDCTVMGCAVGWGNCDADYIDVIRHKNLFCGSDFASQPYIKATIVDSEFKGASTGSILLPRVGAALELNRTKIASAITTISSSAPFYSTGATGTLYLNNVEFANQSELLSPANQRAFITAASIEKIKIRNSVMLTFGDNFPHFVKTLSGPVGSWDIQDGELALGGFSNSTMSPTPLVSLNGTVSNLSAQMGVGEVLVVEPRRFYQGYPLQDGWAKKMGAPWPITTGYNTITSSTNLGTLYAGKKIAYVGNSAFNQGRTVFTPAQEILGSATIPSSSTAILVGKGGYIVRTTNGTSFTQVGSGVTSADLYCAVASSNTIVAAGAGGVLLVSADNGLTWSQAVSSAIATTNVLRAATLGGSAFVVVGDGGTILSSTDGTNWTSRSSSTTNTLRGVAYSGSTFAAVGDGTTIRTSSDGTSWSTRNGPNGLTKSLVGIASSGSLFVAIAGGQTQHQTGDLLSSPDGVTWNMVQGVDIPYQTTAIGYLFYSNQGQQLRWTLTGKTTSGSFSMDGLNWQHRGFQLPDMLKLRQSMVGIEGYQNSLK